MEKTSASKKIRKEIISCARVKNTVLNVQIADADTIAVAIAVYVDVNI